MADNKNSNTLTRQGFFGVRAKIYLLLGFVALVFIFASLFTIYNLFKISDSLQEITVQELPLTNAIEKALVAVLKGELALDSGLLIDDPNNMDLLVFEQESLAASIATLTSVLDAITWGSESEAFLRAHGGESFKEWERLTAEELQKLVVQGPSQEQIQLAGITNIYFAGFAQNATKALAQQQRFLELVSARKGVGTYSAEEQIALSHALDYEKKAIGYLNLVVENLSNISRISTENIVSSVFAIQEIQTILIRDILIISLIGLILAMAVTAVFTAKNITAPLRVLTGIAKQLSKGDYSLRVPITTHDEIGVLGGVFNQMAEHIERQSSERVKKLQELVGEQDRIAKLLIRRDLELSRANEKLSDLDRAKSEFVSVAAHQMRTPLSATKWALDLVLDGDLGPMNDEQKGFLSKGKESNDRMIQLVNDLLDVDHIESGKITYSFLPVQITDLLNNLMTDVLPEAARNHINLEYKNREQTFSKVMIDGEKMRSVFQNLLENALRYTSKGGSATISVSEEDKGLTVAVSDTGIGIPKDQQKKIFSKFFRGSNAIKKEPNGSGLGLFIAKNIVDKHDGRLWFESAVNKGTTFYVFLPTVKSAKS